MQVMNSNPAHDVRRHAPTIDPKCQWSDVELDIVPGPGNLRPDRDVALARQPDSGEIAKVLPVQINKAVIDFADPITVGPHADLTEILRIKQAIDRTVDHQTVAADLASENVLIAVPVPLRDRGDDRIVVLDNHMLWPDHIDHRHLAPRMQLHVGQFQLDLCAEHGPVADQAFERILFGIARGQPLAIPPGIQFHVHPLAVDPDIAVWYHFSRADRDEAQFGKGARHVAFVLPHQHRGTGCKRKVNHLGQRFLARRMLSPNQRAIDRQVLGHSLYHHIWLYD